jgi:hypothetical protein
MPPRFLTLTIVAVWLAMAGLFLARDVWPRLAPSEPLLFPVEIVDDVAGQRYSDLANWLVLKNGGGGYRAEVEWRYVPEDDSFESHCKLNLRMGEEVPHPRGAALWPEFRKVDVDSVYRLTRAGQMKGLRAKTTYSLTLTGQEVGAVAEVAGEPHAGRFAPHVKLSFPDLQGVEQLGPFTLKDFECDAAPVPVSERGIVLNPLHPPRRLPGLRPDQRWRVTAIDPFAVLGLVAPLAGAGGAPPPGDPLPDAGAYVLDAHVLAEPQTFFWEEKNEAVRCRVVKCTGDGPVPALTLTLWAREGDGLLLKQEYEYAWGDVWTFLRRPMAYRMHPVPRAPGATK